MAIPKIIYQTFKDDKLPFITRWQIKRFRKKNPSWQYEFYSDERIESFLVSAYGEDMLNAYQRIQIGAVKADFFRYAILYKKGGLYLDIDSRIAGRLDDFILPGDVAIISKESHPNFYVQWGLIYAAGHPFLQRTIEIMLDNIAANRYPNSGHEMTGPTVYTKAINDCLEKDPSIPHRVLGVDYNGHLVFKYPFNKLLYKKGEHWKTAQLTKTVLKPG